jgi:hypothetical protein
MVSISEPLEMCYGWKVVAAREPVPRWTDYRRKFAEKAIGGLQIFANPIKKRVWAANHAGFANLQISVLQIG